MGDSMLDRDSLPDINVDQLTDSVNNAVNAGLLPPLPLLPHPPTPLLPPPPPPPSFPGMSPGLPPVPVTRLPPLPIFSTLPPFPVPMPVPASDTGTQFDTSSCLSTRRTTRANKDNKCSGDHTVNTTTATTTVSTSTTTSNTSNSDSSSTGDQLPSSQPVSFPVSLPGCPPMFITFSLQLPLADPGPGVSRERTLSSLAPVAGPRLPPFPPPFPLLFPMLPPPQDGRPLRPLLPYPDPSQSGSSSSSQNVLPLPPVSFPQGLPLPPLLLQLPSSLPLPPLLPPSPTSTSQGGLPLPPLLPQPPSSSMIGGLSLPSLLPHPPGSMPQNGLPPLLHHPPNSEAQASFPLPPFPPQSFAAFVQSGLPMTSLSSSNLPLPPLLPPVPPMSDVSLPMLPMPPVMTATSSDGDCHTSVTYSCPPATSCSPDTTNMPFPPMAFPPLPPLLPQKESSARDSPTPPLSLPLPPMSSTGLSGPPTPTTLLASLASQHMLPPPLPGQLFPPLPFIPGAPHPPGFLGQMSGTTLTDCDGHQQSPQSEVREKSGEKSNTENQMTASSQSTAPYHACHCREEQGLKMSDLEVNESGIIGGSSAPSSVESEDLHKSTCFQNVESRSESLDNKQQQTTFSALQKEIVTGGSLPRLAVSSESSKESQDADNSNSTEPQSSHKTVFDSSSSISSQCSSVASLSSHDSNYLQLSASHAEAENRATIAFGTQFTDNDQTLLTDHVLHQPTAERNTDLHQQHSALGQVPNFLQSFGKSGPNSVPGIPHSGLSSEGVDGMFPTSFQTSSTSALGCSQAQYAQDISEDLSNGDQTVMHYSESGDNSVLTHLVTSNGQNHALSQLQVGVPMDPFSLPSLSTADQNQNQGLLHQSLPPLHELQNGHCTDASVLTDTLSSSCEVGRQVLQGSILHHQSASSDPTLIPSLSEQHHPALADLNPTFTTLTHSGAHNSHLNTSAASAINMDCSGLGSGDQAYHQFQNSLATEFNFTAPCTPQVSMGQEQQALLPAVGYSPPGLSDQGLSPNLFGPSELGPAEHDAVVDKQSQSLQDVRSESAGGLGLTSMSASVLDMLLKEDLPVDKEVDGIHRTDTSGAGDHEMGVPDTRQLVPAFTGQFCVECNRMYPTACQHHSTRHQHVADTPILTRARASLPFCLKLGQSKVVGHFNDTGVFAKEKVPAKTEFGPLQGKLEQPSDKVEGGSFTRWKIFYNGSIKMLDISEENESNWLMFLKPAKNAMERNILVFQRDHNIAYVTCKDIEPDTELLFWFSTDYCRMLGLTGKRSTAASEHCPHCPVCSRVYFDRKQLRQHTLQQHKEAVKRKWYCTVCSAGFRSTAKLNAHVCTCHMNLKPHTCQICGKGFSCASNLKKHRLVHTGVKKFQCDVCGQHFMQKAHLKSHQITHTGTKMAQCGYCGKRFNRATDMRQHELQHTKEQTWNCELCNKTFYRAVLLRRHMKVHNNERNYMCEWCSKTFYTKYHLTRHGWSCKWAKGAMKQAPSSSSSRTSVSSLSLMTGQNSIKVMNVSDCARASNVVNIQSSRVQGQLLAVGPVVIGLGQTVPCHEIKS